jgi:hypothetical protein
MWQRRGQLQRLALNVGSEFFVFRFVQHPVTIDVVLIHQVLRQVESAGGGGERP